VRRSRLQQGFSLLEMILVLALAAASLLYGFRLYQHFLWRKDVAVVEQSVNILKNAGLLYWGKRCRSGIIPINPITVAELAADNDLQANEEALIQNPWSSIKPAYTLSIIDKAGMFELQINSEFNLKTQKFLESYVGLLGADSDSTLPTLSWTWLPNYSATKQTSALWPSRWRLTQFNKTVEGNACYYA